MNRHHLLARLPRKSPQEVAQPASRIRGERRAGRPAEHNGNVFDNDFSGLLAPPRPASVRKRRGTAEEGSEEMERLLAPVVMVNQFSEAIHARHKKSQLDLAEGDVSA